MEEQETYESSKTDVRRASRAKSLQKTEQFDQSATREISFIIIIKGGRTP